MVDKLISKLRYMGKQYATGMESRGGGLHKHYLEEAADELESLHAELETLRREREELLAALENVLLAHEQEAKAQRAYEVANENYSDPKPESEAWGSAMIEASAAEKRAYAAIAKVKGE